LPSPLLHHHSGFLITQHLLELMSGETCAALFAPFLATLTADVVDTDGVELTFDQCLPNTPLVANMATGYKDGRQGE
jgi:hypothetical protein